MTLSPRQQRFVEEYLVDLNGTQAAIRAGYSEKGAHVQASQLLSNPKVNEAVAAAMAERSQRTKITQDRVLEEYARLAFSNMQDFVRVGDDGDGVLDLSTLTEDQFRAISEYNVDVVRERDPEDSKKTREVRKIKLKLYDKKSTLDSVARHLGMFTEKHELSGPGGKPIENHWTVEYVNASPQSQPET